MNDKDSSSNESATIKLPQNSFKNSTIIESMTGNAKRSPLMVFWKKADSLSRETEVMKRVTSYWHHSLFKEKRPWPPKEKLNENSSSTWDGSPKTASIWSKLSLPPMPLVKTNTLLKTESKPWKNKESIICTETQEIWKVSAQSPPFKPTSEEVKKETFWTDWTTGRKASFTSTLTYHGCQDCSGSQTRPNHQQFTWKECQRLRRKPKSFQFQPTSSTWLMTWRRESRWTTRPRTDTWQQLIWVQSLQLSCSQSFDKWSDMKANTLYWHLNLLNVLIN